MTVYIMRRAQRGAVLIVSLIILLLMTLIGTVAISVTTLDTKLAANSRDRQLAFQAGETAIIVGESLVESMDISDIPSLPSYHAAMASDWWRSNGDSWWVTDAATDATYEGQGKPRYVIQEPVVGPPAGEMVTSVSLGDGPTPRTFYYPVTARGEGPGGSPVYLQSVFARKVYLAP